jgi:hypothetical protein
MVPKATKPALLMACTMTGGAAPATVQALL